MSTTIKSLKTKIKVTFFISEEATRGAKEIFLCCESNGWQPIAMEKSTAKTNQGSFSVSIDLPKKDLKDSYEYRFQYIMEDGSSIYDNDWNADGYRPSPFGNDNSYFNTSVAEEVVEENKPKTTRTKCATKSSCRCGTKTTKTTRKTAKKES